MGGSFFPLVLLFFYLYILLLAVLLSGIMLVYDITNAKSFDNIAKWLRNIGAVRALNFLSHLSLVLLPGPVYLTDPV